MQTARYLIGSLAKVRGVALRGGGSGGAGGGAEKGAAKGPAAGRGGGRRGSDGSGGGGRRAAEGEGGGATSAHLQGSVRYLTDSTLSSVCPATRASDLLDPNVQLAAMRWRARQAVTECADALLESTSAGATEGEAWNAHAVALVHASRAHVYLNIAACFAVAVARRGVLEEELGIADHSKPGQPSPGDTVDILTGRRVEDSDFHRVSGHDVSFGGFGRFKQDPGSRSMTTPPAKPSLILAGPGGRRARRGRAAGGDRGESSEGGGEDRSALLPSTNEEVTASPLYPALKALCDLFTLHHIQQDLAAYLRAGYFTPSQARAVDAHVAALCSQVRAMALPITDAFNWSDHIIASPLGRRDGDVYGAYMHHVTTTVPEATQSAHLGPQLAGRAPYFTALIKPALTGEDMERALADTALLHAAGRASDSEWASLLRGHAAGEVADLYRVSIKEWAAAGAPGTGATLAADARARGE
jgi:hypothetical protein